MADYEFWDEEREFYERFFSRINQDDLRAIWKTIAENAKGDWLDIGSGDGSLLANVFQMTKDVRLTCLEPSQHAVLDLSKNLPVQKMIVEPLSKKTVLDQYDFITLMHSNYYFEPGEYMDILGRLLASLKSEGRLLILTISEKGDFQKLGDYPYDRRLLAENTYAIIKEFDVDASLTRFHTRFDSTDYIMNNSDEIIKELFHYKRFVTHNNDLLFSPDMVKAFRQRIKEISKQNGNRHFMDYQDCIIRAGSLQL